MKKYTFCSKKHKKLGLYVLLGLAMAGIYPAASVMAMPQGGVIAGGSGAISTSGSAMTVSQNTQNLFVNWDSFSVGKGEKVQFTGPQDFAVLNRVVGHDESKIYGEISAANHGNVYLVNPNGILIGDGAVINAGSFVACTKDVVDVPSFIASGKVTFRGDAQGNIINLGEVKADHIEMHGDTISLKAANVEKNFNAPKVTIDANAIHAGVWDGETTDAVNQKLGVTAEAFQLKDTMQDLRKAVETDSHGHFMLNGDDLKDETWSNDAPNLDSGASIDGLGYTVANKHIQDCQDGSGIFSYATGGSKESERVRIENFTFDHTKVEGQRGSYTGTLVGYLDGDGIRIANVTVSEGVVVGYDYVGGLVGYSDNFRNGNVFLNVHNVNTSVRGMLEKEKSGDKYTGIGIGGILGYESGRVNWDNSQNVFRNVSNSGTVIGREHVGGIAGHLVTADMDQVRNTGRIEQQTVGTLVHSKYRDYMKYEDSRYIGGIAGSIGPSDEAAAHVRISHAYNGGIIGVDTREKDYYTGGSYIGGIVGMLSGGSDGDIKGASDTVIDYAHNAGTITAGNNNVGGIVGFATGLGKDHEENASDMMIRHSWNDGSIQADYSGGIAGTFGGTIEESYNNGPLGEYSGGLVAATESVLSNDVVIRDSYNSKLGMAHVGGIIGVDYTEGTTVLERVWNDADILVTTNYSGGIIGDAQNCGSITLNKVYNFGTIIPNTNDDVGGLIGHDQVLEKTGITFNQCANYGKIQGGTVSGSEEDELGGFIGTVDTVGKNFISINDCANFGDVFGSEYLGGFIGELYDTNDENSVLINRSYNYGSVTSLDGEKSAAGLIGYQYISTWSDNDKESISIQNSGTVGDKPVGFVGADVKDSNGKYNYQELTPDFAAQTGIKDIPDAAAYANEQFLAWKENVTVDSEGNKGTETGSYPDGGYVWKMYETGGKDSDGHMLYYKPELTAFQTKVETRQNSVELGAGNVAGAFYDVTMPDGQQIQGVDWNRVLELQNQFTRVQNRGVGSDKDAYSASDGESGGRVPDHLYGFYHSSQQGLNIFITPGTVKPKESPDPEPIIPEKWDLPSRSVSRNDYLYSDEHDTGDGEQHEFMHMPPVVYVKDGGLRLK